MQGAGNVKFINDIQNMFFMQPSHWVHDMLREKQLKRIWNVKEKQGHNVRWHQCLKLPSQDKKLMNGWQFKPGHI